jgi:hypothetical protein
MTYFLKVIMINSIYTFSREAESEYLPIFITEIRINSGEALITGTLSFLLN